MITTDQFYKIAGVTQHSQFQKFLEDIVFDKAKRKQFYQSCIDIDPQCVEDDTFRRYFEEYAAERKSNQQDFTPTALCNLMAQLTDDGHNVCNSGWTAIDPAAGTGSMLLAKWKAERNKHLPWEYYPHNYLYLAQELSDVAIPYLIHNLAIRGMNAIVIHGNTLERTAKQIYFIQNVKDDPMFFSNINVLPHTDDVMHEFDITEWMEEPINHVEDKLSDLDGVIGNIVKEMKT